MTLKLELKFCTMADVTTGHITRKDNEILELYQGQDNGVDSGKRQAVHPQVILRHFYGYIISAWHWHKDNRDEIADTEKALLALGHSPSYVNACRVAGMLDHKWICFDCDGEDYDWLPTHDWSEDAS